MFEALSETDACVGHRNDRGGMPRRRLCRTRGYYQPAPTGYGNPYYNSGY